MIWVKRNLFFVVGGVVALALLGFALYYNYAQWSRNSDEVDKLKEICATLNSLNGPDSNPGNDKVNKIEQAKDQESQWRAWLDQTKSLFEPISPIPAMVGTNSVTSKAFGESLLKTIALLQHEADAANVVVPNTPTGKYAFSFQAESTLVTYSPGGLGGLAQQLGEVKTISELLFSAGVNEIVSIQRPRVADEDASGPPTDYVSDAETTNNLAIITPYVISFQSFGPEVARVLQQFSASPKGFVIKTFNVSPAGPNSGVAIATPFPGGYGRGGMRMPDPMMNGQANPGADKSGLTTVLKEQLLRVTMQVELIKLLPKK